jgi:DNA adenine methylase
VTKRKLIKASAKASEPAKRGLRSPFRYAGGKSWFVKTACQWLNYRTPRPKLLVEPFAGGANISLSAVHSQLVDKAAFAELDRDVAATWKTILNGRADWLASEIRSFRISRPRVEEQLRRKPASQHERAFLCLLRNRTARGGVIAEGAGLIRKGEDGRGLRSRWYPQTIADRIAAISALKGRLDFCREDGFNLIKKHQNEKGAVFFVDPPYTKAARRLYRHWEIDHENLFRVLQQVAGDVLMTYDDTREVRQWAKTYGFQVKTISMRTTHHKTKRELMICKDFDWLKSPRVESQKAFDKSIKTKRAASIRSGSN